MTTVCSSYTMNLLIVSMILGVMYVSQMSLPVAPKFGIVDPPATTEPPATPTPTTTNTPIVTSTPIPTTTTTSASTTTRPPTTTTTTIMPPTTTTTTTTTTRSSSSIATTTTVPPNTILPGSDLWMMCCNGMKWTVDCSGKICYGTNVVLTTPVINPALNATVTTMLLNIGRILPFCPSTRADCSAICTDTQQRLAAITSVDINTLTPTSNATTTINNNAFFVTLKYNDFMNYGCNNITLVG